MSELGDFGRDAGEGVMIEVEIDEEGEGEETRCGRDVLDLDAAHVE